MYSSEFSTTIREKRINRFYTNLFIILSILLGFLCLLTFILISIHWNINSSLQRNCTKTNTIICYIRTLIADGHRTQWNRYILVTLLLTYANVFFHMIIETSRINVTGLLGQTIIQTICIIFGIGVSFPILYLSSYIYFYQTKTNLNKSTVKMDRILIAFLYTIFFIIIPTYLVYFVSINSSIFPIISIILLISPIAFPFFLLPFNLISKSIENSYLINNHRFIIQCQIILFILSTPLFFIIFIALIRHQTSDLFQQSYMIELSNKINPTAIIWSIDYLSLLISLLLFICINEYLVINNSIRTKSSIIQKLIIYFICTIMFILTPCLVFPLYIAWKEYQYLKRI